MSVQTFPTPPIAASDLPSGIDAAKIANGTVSNTEFQYINSVTSDVQTQIDGKVPATRNVGTGSPLTGGGALSGDLTLDFDETVTLGNNARVAVNKNSGATVGTRRRINFIEGSNVTLTVADDAGNEEVDVTIASSGGGSGITELTGDVTAGPGSGAQAATIANDSVTFAKMQEIATDRLIGRDTALTGNPEELTVGGGLEFTGSGGIQTSAFTGDVTKSAGGTSTTIAADAVTNAMLRDSGALSVIGRSANSTGNPADISATAATDAVLRESGSTIGWGTIATAGIANSAVTEVKLGISDNTTGNVTTSAHGFVVKAPNSTVQWFRGDASWSAVPGRYLSKTVYAASASGTFTTTANTTLIRLRMVGGGGGGGGAASSTNNGGAAGGGGSGAYLEAWITVAGSTGYSYTVGSKGTGGTAGNNDGNNGTSSTFGPVSGTTYTAPLGSGGKGMAAGSGVAVSAGGDGGTIATNGDVNFTGAKGVAGRRAAAANAAGGDGGVGPFGGAGNGTALAASSSNPGGAAGAAGSGGGGASASGNGNSAAGGDGADGIIIIEEYS